MLVDPRDLLVQGHVGNPESNSGSCVDTTSLPILFSRCHDTRLIKPRNTIVKSVLKNDLKSLQSCLDKTLSEHTK